jgi:hypothetical protein
MRHVTSMLLFVVAVAGGCSAQGNGEDTKQARRKATPEAIQDIDPDGVEVVALERAALKWTWTAKADGAVYACDADEQMRLLSCTKKS